MVTFDFWTAKTLTIKHDHKIYFLINTSVNMKLDFVGRCPCGSKLVIRDCMLLFSYFIVLFVVLCDYLKVVSVFILILSDARTSQG